MLFSTGSCFTVTNSGTALSVRYSHAGTGMNVLGRLKQALECKGKDGALGLRLIPWFPYKERQNKPGGKFQPVNRAALGAYCWKLGKAIGNARRISNEN